MTIRFACAFVCAALFAAPALAGDREDAKAFVERLYARYADGGEMNDVEWKREIYDTAMLALLAEDERLTPEGDVGVLDWDPVCQCQDFMKLRATVNVRMTGAHTAVATVRFNDIGMVDKSFRNATLDLVKEANGWRIHDIHSKDFENPQHSMRARFIEANAERRHGH